MNKRMLSFMPATSRRFIQNEAGTTAVEFALVAMIFLTIIFAIIDTGRLFMSWNAFQRATEDATRYVITDTDASTADITDQVIESMNGFPVDNSNIDINVDFFTQSGVDFVEVSGSYAFTPLLGAVLPDSWSNLDLSAASRMPLPAPE